jgi:N-acyl amino acid synthase FeeM
LFLSTLSDSPSPTLHPGLYRPLRPHSPHSSDERFGQALARVADAGSNADFVISAPREAAERLHAAELLRRRYAWRGYRVNPLEGFASPSRLTLVAALQEAVVGTLTASVETADGLYVERLYPDEVAALRSSGARLCEFTRLAVDDEVRSPALLAAMFHVASMYAIEIHHCSHVLIEVNPRHVRFYEQMLNFRRAGEARMDPAVAAPAVLMQLDLAVCAREIDRLSGRPSPRRQRSFYPHFFAKDEAQRILGRLRVH